MFRWRVTVSVFSILLTPTLAHGAVLINEIAWMGTAESHFCNWIELYNSGTETVDVGEWTLEINDTVRAIADGDSERGAGTEIPSGAYWVLERYTNTCPDPVPAVSDWYLAFGNLPNSGATLTLRRPDGTIEDQVAGGDDWQNLGGDNETKETAQRTDAGWITGDPTPGAVNVDTTASSQTSATTNATTTSQSASGASSARLVRARGEPAVPLEVPDVDLAVQIEGPAVWYVNQPISLQAEASGLGPTWLNSLRYYWNFGDGQTDVTGGDQTEHTFSFPGTYVVTVEASYQHYTQIARHEVVVVPVSVSLTNDEFGNIQLHNDSGYEVNVSGYQVVGPQTVTLPPHTILLPNATVTIPRGQLATTPTDVVVVRDADGQVLTANHSVTETEEVNPAAVVARTEYAPQRVPAADEQSNQDRPNPAVLGVATSTARATSAPVTNSPAAVAAPAPVSPSGPPWWSYVALLILLGIAALVLWPAAQSGVVDPQQKE